MYVRVRAAAEDYAVAVESTREVAELRELSSLPGAPSTVLGLVNLRGEVLPVISLPAALGLAPDTAPTRFVVVEDDRGRRAGLAVDELLDVGLLEGSAEPADDPRLERAVAAEGRLVGVLDLAPLLDAAVGSGGAA